MKKILTTFLFNFLVLFVLLLDITLPINASMEGWTYPSDWSNAFYMSNPETVNIDDASKNWTAIQTCCLPNFEYQIKVIRAYDYEYEQWYMGLIINFWLNPNNFRYERCRSDLVTITTSVLNGKVIDGGPTNQNSSTIINTAVGSNLAIGFQGTLVTTPVSGSFTTSKTGTVYDLSVLSERQKVNTSDNYYRQFKSSYDYYKPYRNNIDYLETTSKLQYAAIYKVNNPYSMSVDISFFAGTVFDYWLWNATVTKTLKLELSGNLLSGSIYIN